MQGLHSIELLSYMMSNKSKKVFLTLKLDTPVLVDLFIDNLDKNLYSLWLIGSVLYFVGSKLNT